MTRASVYNGHLRGPVTLIPVAERLAVELTRLRSVAAGIRTPLEPPACEANALTDCATAAVILIDTCYLESWRKQLMDVSYICIQNK